MEEQFDEQVRDIQRMLRLCEDIRQRYGLDVLKILEKKGGMAKLKRMIQKDAGNPRIR